MGRKMIFKIILVKLNIIIYTIIENNFVNKIWQKHTLSYYSNYSAKMVAVFSVKKE